MSKSDADVYALISEKPSSESYPNASKWYVDVTKELVSSFLEDDGWVGIVVQAASGKGSASAAEAKNVGQESIAEDDVVEEERKRKRAEDVVDEETEEAAEEKAAEERKAAKASKSKSWKWLWGVYVRNENARALEDKVCEISKEITSVLAARSILAQEVDGFKGLSIALLVVDDESAGDVEDDVRKFMGLRYVENPTFYNFPCFVFGDD